MKAFIYNIFNHLVFTKKINTMTQLISHLLSDIEEDFKKNFFRRRKTTKKPAIKLSYDSMMKLAYRDELHSDFIAHKQFARFNYVVLLFKNSMSQLTGAGLKEKIINELRKSAAKNKSKIYDEFIKELEVS